MPVVYIFNEYSSSGQKEEAVPPPPENLPFTTSQNRMLVTIFNDRYSNDDGTEVEHLPTIREDAKKIQDLLKTDFGYEVPSDDPTIFEPGKLENQPNLVKTFEVFLKKWKRKSGPYYEHAYLSLMTLTTHTLILA